MSVHTFAHAGYQAIRVRRRVDGVLTQRYFPHGAAGEAAARALDQQLAAQQAVGRAARMATRAPAKRPRAPGCCCCATGVRGITLRERGTGCWSVVLQVADASRSFSVARLGLKGAWCAAVDALTRVQDLTAATRRRLLRLEPPPPPNLRAPRAPRRRPRHG